MKILCILICLCSGYVTAKQQTIWTSVRSETPVSLNPNGGTQMHGNSQDQTEQIQTDQVQSSDRSMQFPIRQHRNPVPTAQLQDMFPNWAYRRPVFIKVPAKPTYLGDIYLDQLPMGPSNPYPFKFPSQGNADMFDKMKLLSEYTRDFKMQNMEMPTFLPRRTNRN